MNAAETAELGEFHREMRIASIRLDDLRESLTPKAIAGLTMVARDQELFREELLNLASCLVTIAHPGRKAGLTGHLQRPAGV